MVDNRKPKNSNGTQFSVWLKRFFGYGGFAGGTGGGAGRKEKLRRWFAVFALVVLMGAIGFNALWVRVPAAYGRVTAVYSTAGTDTFTVPAGVMNVTVKAWGAGGGGGGGTNTTGFLFGGSGGGGGFAQADLAVTPGEVLNIRVGAGGAGGAVGGGGGFSGVYQNSESEANYLVIGGGGGGGGKATGSVIGGDGGAGGGSSGVAGNSGQASGATAGGGGGGGTSSTGGSGGTAGTNGGNGTAGSILTGGSGGASTYGGGGGGAGRYGGGGGGATNHAGGGGGGGGGGSGKATGSNTVLTAGVNSTDIDYVAGVGDGGGGSASFSGSAGGDGRVVISYYAPPTVSSVNVSGAERSDVVNGFTITGTGFSNVTTHTVVDTFTSNGTWTAPAGVTSATVEAWGAGGGGTTNTRSGGGGAYAAGTVAVTPGNGYSVVVGTSAANTTGGNSTFNSTSVVAEGGRSGTAGGQGGLSSNSTGNIVTRSGGSGSTGTGSRGGGGAAGDSANGNAGSTSGYALGGAVNGGMGGLAGGSATTTGVGSLIGGGGGSATSAQAAGGRGEVRVTYNVQVTDGSPVVKARSYGRTTSNTSSHAITMPSGIEAGDLLLIVFGVDANETSTISSGNWIKLGDASNSINVTQAVFYKFAEGSDTATVATTPEESSYIVYRISGATNAPTATFANGSSTNADPPSHTPAAGSNDYLWIAAAVWDWDSQHTTITAAPSGYGDFIIEPSGTGVGATTATAEIFFEGTSQDPGAFTSGTEQWVASTIAVPGGITPMSVKLTKSGETDIDCANIVVTSSTEVTCDLTIPSDAAYGAWNVVVSNPGGGNSATLANAFTVILPPTVSAVDPASGNIGATLTDWQITGTDFINYGTPQEVVETFTSSGTFSVPEGVTEVDVLVVGGGGGGGAYRGGGGGAGGVIYEEAYDITSLGSSIAVTVGGGGAGGNGATGTNGSNSSFGGALTAVGGGGGGVGTNSANGGGNGGSGGGAGGAAVTGSQSPGTGTVGQGNAGGDSADDNATVNRAGGGGGGAGAVGSAAADGFTGGNGGVGLNLASEFGTGVGASGWFGGGGGGSTNGTGDVQGTGGTGGGGAANASGNATAGIANTGGGGGGAGGGAASSNVGGAGGSGIVIVRYLDPGEAAPPVVKLVKSGQSDIECANETFVSSTEINCDLTISSDVASGDWDVVVTNTDGGVGTLTEGFAISIPDAAASVTLANGAVGATQNTTLSLTLPGNLASGDTVIFTMPGNLDVSGVAFGSDTFAGAGTFSGCSSSGQTITCTAGGAITAGTGNIVMTGITPRYAATGQTVKNVSVNSPGAEYFSQVGNDSSNLSLGSGVLAALSSTRIAFIHVTNQRLQTWDFDGTDWIQVGSPGLALGDVGSSSIAALSSTRVATLGGTSDELRVYDFDGSSWSQVGNALSISTTSSGMAALSSTRVALVDASVNTLRTYDFDGTNWSQTGNGLTVSPNFPALAALSSTRVAFFDNTNDDLRVYEFNGTNWSQVGNDLNISTTGTPALAALSSNRVVFIDSSNDILQTYYFDGTNWNLVGSGLNLSGIGTPSIGTLSSSRIAFVDTTNDVFRAYDFNEPTIVAADASGTVTDTTVTDAAVSVTLAGNATVGGTGDTTLGLTLPRSLVSGDTVEFAMPSNLDVSGVTFSSETFAGAGTLSGCAASGQIITCTSGGAITAGTGNIVMSDITANYAATGQTVTNVSVKASSSPNLGGLSYDSVNFSTSAQSINTVSVFLKPDGTKMYIASDSNQVHEYDLSIAWDVSSATLLQSLNVVTNSPGIQGFHFKPDGTKLYVVHNTGDEVDEYNLSSAWNISTAVYSQAFSVTNEIVTPLDVFFKPDGTKMYVVGQPDSEVNEYNLSVAWDVSSASFVQNFVVADWESVPHGLYFDSTGTVLYITGSGAGEIQQFTLSSAWNISTASFLSNFSVSSQDSSPRGIFVNSDNTKLYVVGSDTDTVYQYSLPNYYSMATDASGTVTNTVAADAAASVTLAGNATVGGTGNTTLALTLPLNLASGDTVVFTMPNNLNVSGVAFGSDTFAGAGTFSGCAAAGQVVTCTSGGAITAGTGNIVMTGITALYAATGQTVTSVAVRDSSASDADIATDASGTVTDTVSADAAASVTLAGNATVGGTGNTTFTFTLPQNMAASDTATFTMPPNLDVNNVVFSSDSFAGAGSFACADSGQVVTCTANGAITAGTGNIVMTGITSLYAATGQTVTDTAVVISGLTVATDASGTVTNTVAADAAASVTLAGNATVGGTGNTTLALTLPLNLASGDTVVFTMPSNLDVSGVAFGSDTFAGAGTFSGCAASGQEITCTSGGAITAGTGNIVMTGITALYAATGQTVTSVAVKDTSNGGADMATDASGTVTNTVAADAAASVTLAGNATVGASGNTTLTLTLPVNLVSGDTATFTMPNNLNVSGVAFGSDTFAGAGTFSGCVAAGQVVTCTSGGAITAGTGNIVMTGITSLYAATGQTVTNLAVNAFTADGADIATDASGTVTDTVAADAAASVTLGANATVGASGDTTLTLTLPVDLVSGDTIVFTLPDNLNVSGAAFGSETFAGAGTFSGCAAAGQVVTCTSGGAITAGTGNIVMSGITSLYVATGQTVTSVVVNDASASGADIATDASGTVTDTVAADANASVLLGDNANVGVAGTTQLFITLAVDLANGDTVVFTMPNNLDVSGVSFFSRTPFGGGAGSFSACTPVSQTITCTANGAILAGSGRIIMDGIIATQEATGQTVTNVTIRDNSNGDAITAFDASGAVTDTVNVSDADTSTFTANPTTGVVANGTDSSILTVTLRNSSSAIVVGKTVAVSDSGPGTITYDAINCSTQASLSNSPPNEAVSDSNGQACFEVTTTTAGTYTFTADDNTNTVTLTTQPTVTFVAGGVSVGNSTVAVDLASVPADGSTGATITVTVRDSNNNPVPGRDIEISDNQDVGEVDYVGYPTPTPYPSDTTNASGQVTFEVNSLVTGSYTFTVTDITGGGSTTLGTVDVEFTCILNADQQCIQVDIDPAAGVLTVTSPSDFSFPALNASFDIQDIFSINSPSNGYQLNVDDIITVTDTQNVGGFTLQMQAGTFQDPGTLETLPLTDFWVVTTAASTGGLQSSGVEYPSGYAGVQAITASQDTSGSLTDRATFTTDGSALDQIIDLMLAPVTVAQGGRNGTFKQNIQYHLRVPALKPPGDYAVTLTFDLTRTDPQ